MASFILRPRDPLLPTADNTSSSNNKLRLIPVLMELYVTPVNCFITESVLLILFTTPAHETGQNIVTELFLRTSNFAELFLMIFLWNQKCIFCTISCASNKIVYIENYNIENWIFSKNWNLICPNLVAQEGTVQNKNSPILAGWNLTIFW